VQLEKRKRGVDQSDVMVDARCDDVDFWVRFVGWRLFYLLQGPFQPKARKRRGKGREKRRFPQLAPNPQAKQIETSRD
jgi:hypothetical protein